MHDRRDEHRCGSLGWQEARHVASRPGKGRSCREGNIRRARCDPGFLSGDRESAARNAQRRGSLDKTRDRDVAERRSSFYTGAMRTESARAASIATVRTVHQLWSSISERQCWQWWSTRWIRKCADLLIQQSSALNPTTSECSLSAEAEATYLSFSLAIVFSLNF